MRKKNPINYHDDHFIPSFSTIHRRKFHYKLLLILSVLIAILFIIQIYKNPLVQRNIVSNFVNEEYGKDKDVYAKKRAGQIKDDIVTFHLVFTNAEFSKMNCRCIESIFYFHPSALLIIHSNALQGIHTLEQRQLEPIQKLKDLGYNIEIIPYDPADVLQKAMDAPGSVVNKTLATEYIALIPTKYSKEDLWVAHESDLVRTCVLYLTGGIYLDTDVIVVRPFLIVDPPHEIYPNRNAMRQIPRNFITDYDGLEADNVMSINYRANCIENAVMKFLKPRNPFLGHAINDFMKNYNGWWWVHNGPAVYWRVAHEMPQFVCQEPFEFVASNVSNREIKSNVPECHFQPLPITAFFPVLWNEWFDLCYNENKSTVGLEAKKIISHPNVYCVHMNNHQNGPLIEKNAYFPDTLCDVALKHFCILCE